MSDIETAKNFASWFRTGSILLAGIKISGAAMTWLSTGIVARWFVDKFYPFTRLLWGDLFSWLSLPQLSDIQKDALTALVFFLPLGISSVWAAISGRLEREYYETKDFKSDRLIGLLFGFTFFLVLCAGILSNLGFGK